MSHHKPSKPLIDPRYLPPHFKWIVFIGALSVLASWIPLVMIARARANTSEKSRIHIFQDMDQQPKLKAQASSDLFADGRAMRPRVPGAMPRGADHLQEDEFYYQGKINGAFAAGFPDQVKENGKITEAFVRRGMERYNIYCSMCHGYSGHGDGSVQKSVMMIGDIAAPHGWPIPKTLHSNRARGIDEGTTPGLSNGGLFDIITNGVPNTAIPGGIMMPRYGPQIPVADRWAIVAYIRALQISQEEIYKKRNAAPAPAAPAPAAPPAPAVPAVPPPAAP